jgi:DNA processing protein
VAERLATDLVAHGITVISGLARGIDTAAHHASVSAAGRTIGVLANGLDTVYPPQNRQLARDILAGHGALVSEFPPGTPPDAINFPRRNRIIAGLSQGTVVVEAAPKSGSLITARLAAEAGREVMAVPGSPLDPRCRGSNHLLREGARLVEVVDDILTSLGGSVERSEPVDEASEPAAAADHSASTTSAETSMQLVERLGPSPVAVDELVRQCHMPAPVVRAALLDIELAGRLERHPGDRVSLLP